MNGSKPLEVWITIVFPRALQILSGLRDFFKCIKVSIGYLALYDRLGTY